MKPLGAILLAGLSVAPAFAAGPDPWSRVPPLSTGCFPEDGFAERLWAAAEKIGPEIERQREINAAARERLNNMDSAETVQRMQAFLMENPQAAMAMATGGQAAGEAAHAVVPEVNEASVRLDGELKDLQASFLAALERAAKPVLEKQDRLIAAKTVEVGEAAVAMFTTAADLAEHERLVAEENAARERACAPFFGAGGSFHRWLAAFRAEVIEKLIAVEVDRDSVIVAQMKAMGVAGDEYRSTAALERVREYLRKASDVYGARPRKTTPWVSLKR